MNARIKRIIGVWVGVMVSNVSAMEQPVKTPFSLKVESIVKEKGLPNISPEVLEHALPYFHQSFLTIPLKGGEGQQPVPLTLMMLSNRWVAKTDPVLASRMVKKEDTTMFIIDATSLGQEAKQEYQELQKQLKKEKKRAEALEKELKALRTTLEEARLSDEPSDNSSASSDDSSDSSQYESEWEVVISFE